MIRILSLLALFPLAALAETTSPPAWIALPQPRSEDVKTIAKELHDDPPTPFLTAPDNFVRALFHRPGVVTRFAQLDDIVGEEVVGRGLSKREHLILAVLTASRNGCHYCLSGAAEGLRRETKDRPQDVILPPRERAMVNYALKLTTQPASLEQTDVSHLKKAGWTDPQIFDLALDVSWWNFKNRMAKGLGLGPDATHSFSPSAAPRR